MTDLPPIVMKAYDLAIWLLPCVNDFPRSDWFVLGDRLFATVLDLVEGVIEASHRRDKRQALEIASVNARHAWSRPVGGV